MVYPHPDELYRLVQEQHGTLLEEAAQLRLWPRTSKATRHRGAALGWVGVQLVRLGLRLQGYAVQVQQPMVLCCGNLRQQLTSAPESQTNGCISVP